MSRKKIAILISAPLILSASITAYTALVKEKIDPPRPENTVKIEGFIKLAGPDWGIKSLACKEGGFDIHGYDGEKVEIESSTATGKSYQGTPLSLYKVYAGDKLICEYYADATGSLTPGIFSINDPIVTNSKTELTPDAFEEINSYLACGCGCCAGVEPVEKCLYRSKGDDINEIIREDGITAQSGQCDSAGCSKGIKYSYCDQG